MDKIHGENRRRYLRYRPDRIHEDDLNKRAMECTGFVDLNINGDDFQPSIVGLVMDKSHSGCSLAIIGDLVGLETLKQHTEVMLKAGPLSPLRAVIRWRREWDEGIVKVGFEFTE